MEINHVLQLQFLFYIFVIFLSCFLEVMVFVSISKRFPLPRCLVAKALAEIHSQLNMKSVQVCTEKKNKKEELKTPLILSDLFHSLFIWTLFSTLSMQAH